VSFASTGLTSAWYWPWSYCTPAQKFANFRWR